MQNEINALNIQVRNLKRIVYGFWCLLIAVVIIAATSIHQVPNVIQARSFQILNSDGIIVGEFASSGDSGRLGLFDRKGNLTMDCATSYSSRGPAGAQIILKNSDNETTVWLGKYSIGIPPSETNPQWSSIYKGGIFVQDGLISIANSEGQGVVRLSNGNFGGGISLYKNELTESGGDHVLVGLGCDENGGIISTGNNENKTVILLKSDIEGNGQLQTRNLIGATTSTLP